MKTKIIIREAEASDVDFLLDIRQEANFAGRRIYEWEDFCLYPGMPNDLLDFPTGKEFGYIACDMNNYNVGAAWIRIVPHMDIYHAFHLPELTIGIIPSFRHIGIGAMLMETIINKAFLLSLDKLTLNVHIRNDPAISLFKRYGWKINGVFGDFCIMSLDVK